MHDIAHITTTNSAFREIWPMVWATQEAFLRKHPFHSFVWCTDKKDATVPSWYTQVEYGSGSGSGSTATPLGWPKKVLICLRQVPVRNPSN